jgi:hypothetical protein
MSVWIIDMNGDDESWEAEGENYSRDYPGTPFVMGDAPKHCPDRDERILGYATVTVVDADGGLRLALVPVAS